VCAPSNVAVDNITGSLFKSHSFNPHSSQPPLAAKLRAAKLPCVRLGHPARLLPQVLECRWERVALVARHVWRSLVLWGM